MTEVSQTTAPFGKYLLDQELARGGMSRVFRARLQGPAGFEKKLVVKQILPELARDPSFIALFVKEANTLVQMSHPSLVPVYELGVVDGVYFLAMEWVEGATISEILLDGPFPAALAAHVGLQIAEALRYAHERFELVHRDVTPRNVIIDGAGHARLLDFGIAAKVAHTGLGGPDELFGSPGYMAPEQLRGEALGPESDLYALGAVLHEAVSGTPALPRDIVPAPEPVRVPRLTAIDPALSDVIARMLEAERKARPESAAAVASALRGWLAEHHPQGVEQELALRATQAHAAREAAPRRLPSLAPTESSGRIEVRSIAQSPVLDALLREATERIERERGVPATITEAEPPLMADPEAHATVRRYGRDLLILTGALAVAIYWADQHPRTEVAEGVSTLAADATAQPPRGGMSTAALSAANTSRPSAAGVALDMPPRAASPATQASAASPSSETTPEAPAGRAPLAAHPTAGVSAGPMPSAASTGPATANAPTPAQTERSGFVTVSATPWAQVRIDNRAVGITPRRRLALRPGKHTLDFACPPLGKQAHVPLELHADEAVQILVDLHEDPPKITVKQRR